MDANPYIRTGTTFPNPPVSRCISKELRESLQQRPIFWLTFVSFLLLAFWMPAQANDSEAELGIGGLVLKKSPHIEMKSEDLYLSMDEVRVRYRYFNKSTNDVRTIVAFPMPDITPPPREDDDLEVRYVFDLEKRLEFRTSVDGVDIKTEVEQKVIANGVDQTDVLKQLGVSLDPRQGEELLGRLPPQAQDELLKFALVRRSERFSDGTSLVASISPNWTLKTSYYWEQIFPARSELVIDHRYRPVVGGGIPLPRTLLIESLDRRKYCIDDELLRAIRRGRSYSQGWLSYILTTGANWSGPIGSFRLVVDKGAPDNLVSFCGSGVRKIGPTQFEVKAKNFVPKKDIDILFLEQDRALQESDAALLDSNELASSDCEDLWYRRNSIFKEAGYCFKTARAIKAFGNAGCSYDSQGDVPLSETVRQKIRLIQRAEKSKRCRR